MSALRQVPGAQVLLLNVPWTPDAQVAGADWGGDPDTGFLRYACHDRADVRNANPALLSLLQEAIGKHGRLGEVVKYINELLGQQPVKVQSAHSPSRPLGQPADQRAKVNEKTGRLSSLAAVRRTAEALHFNLRRKPVCG